MRSVSLGRIGKPLRGNGVAIIQGAALHDRQRIRFVRLRQPPAVVRGGEAGGGKIQDAVDAFHRQRQRHGTHRDARDRTRLKISG